MSHSPVKVNIITLGCYKNLVDSEQLLNQIKLNNFSIVHNSYNFDAEIVIINTCGFILDAKKESIDSILFFADAKKQNKISKLIVIGCLSQRYKNQLEKEIPEVDKFFGVDSINELFEYLNLHVFNNKLSERIITTPSHYAYLKIAEGCNRKCSFCAIPTIKGKHKSKSIEEIITEAQILASNGVKELILISQDLTYYGIDNYNEQKLPLLVQKLSEIKDIEWIRLQYLFPKNLPEALIQVIKHNKKICKYLDIPFQHISDNVLKLMRRSITQKQTYNLIEKIRNSIPDIALRTSLIVGHPGETKKDFIELINFVKDIKFDRLGVFIYSHEDGTYSFKNYNDNVKKKVKEERYHEIMQLQQSIAEQINKNRIGHEYNIIIDEKLNDNYIGRTEFDSPEIDGNVIIKNCPTKKLLIGNIYKLKITDYSLYDLIV
jgi:ribosomal protein S12 methylthiotransferase